MKLSTAAVILACTNSCAKEQHITPSSRGGDRNMVRVVTYVIGIGYPAPLN